MVTDEVGEGIGDGVLVVADEVGEGVGDGVDVAEAGAANAAAAMMAAVAVATATPERRWFMAEMDP